MIETGTVSLWNLTLSGEYTDAETGFQYLRARYYDPATAQFLTRDPIEAVTQEPYGYVGGNPLNATDPSGLRCLIRNSDGGCKGAETLRKFADDAAIVTGALLAVAYVSCPFTAGAGCAVGAVLNVTSATAATVHAAAQCVDWDAYCWRAIGNAGVAVAGVAGPAWMVDAATQGFRLGVRGNRWA